MKGLGCLVALVAGLVAGPALADPRLAGDTLITVSHGQPFCTDKRQLLALLHASVIHARYGFGAFPSCTYVGDGAKVAVLQDLSPGTRMLHVVRARTDLPLYGAVDGYTWSVGLSGYYTVPGFELFDPAY